MQRLLDHWIPDTLRDDAEALARAQLVLAFTASLIAIAPLYGGYYLAKGYAFGGITILCGALVAVGIGPLLRATGSARAAGIAASAVLFALVAVLTSFSGALQSHTASWLALPAVIALLLAGAGAARWFVGLAVAQMLALLGLARAGIVLPNYLPEAMRATQGLTSVVGLIVILFVLVRRFEGARDRALERAAAAQRALETEKQRVEARVVAAVAESEAQRRYLDERVQEMLSAMRAFADGDLRIRLRPPRTDEIGALYQGFNQALENVGGMLAEVRAAAGTTAEASGGIREATRQLSDGARGQSARAQEVAAAMDQMARTITESAAHAQRSAAGIQEVGQRAVDGGRVIRDAVASIERIAQLMENSRHTVARLGESTASINDVVKLITGIAEQTNLLALNATIEAARAGEHGKGFAVVATEVKQLAGQTAKATGEIAAMVHRVQTEAQHAIEAIRAGHAETSAGRRLADAAGAALREIESGLHDSSGIAARIAAATEEQATTVAATTGHVAEISGAAMTSAGEVERILASADQLRQLTEGLMRHLACFRTHDAPPGRDAAPLRAA
jgi:methyl-accepting chemotaxis protein